VIEDMNIVEDTIKWMNILPPLILEKKLYEK